MEAHDCGLLRRAVPLRPPRGDETRDGRPPHAGGRRRAGIQRRRLPLDDRNRVVDIVQPDLHYYGGFIRSLRVARMADAAGMLCTPHMSGSGLGFLDVAHFASCMPNPVPFHEFKGDTDIPVDAARPRRSSARTAWHLRVPSGPGFGVTIDPAFIRKAVKVTTS